jgi:hypothetical protein
VDSFQGSVPAGLIEEVQDHVGGPGYSVAHSGLLVLCLGREEGPVDEERAAYDVFAWYEAPVAAIQADKAVVAHSEVVARWDDEVSVLDVGGEIDLPGCGYVAALGWRDGGEIVAIRVEAVGSGLSRLRLVLGCSVEVDDAVGEVDVVAGDSDDSLDEKEIRLAGFEEDDDISALDVAVVNEGKPVRGRRQSGAVYDEMIAYEQGLFHRTRGDGKVLEEEGLREEQNHDDSADGGEGLEGRFFYGRLAFLCGLLLHASYQSPVFSCQM